MSQSRDNPTKPNELVNARQVRLVAAEHEKEIELSQEFDLTKVLETPGDLARKDLQKYVHNLSGDEYLKALKQATPDQLESLIQTFDKEAGTASGVSFFRTLMHVPKGPRSLFATLWWWECRRPVFTLAVCLSGLPSLAILYLAGIREPAILAALFYVLCANICYCLGAPAELVARAFFKEARNPAPMLLVLGTTFSVVLTVFLQVLIMGLWAVNMLVPRF